MGEEKKRKYANFVFVCRGELIDKFSRKRSLKCLLKDNHITENANLFY